jgi:hypothetical protein
LHHDVSGAEQGVGLMPPLWFRRQSVAVNAPDEAYCGILNRNGIIFEQFLIVQEIKCERALFP